MSRRILTPKLKRAAIEERIRTAPKELRIQADASLDEIVILWDQVAKRVANKHWNFVQQFYSPHKLKCTNTVTLHSILHQYEAPPWPPNTPRSRLIKSILLYQIEQLHQQEFHHDHANDN